MGTSIFVGNVSFDATEEEIKSLCQDHGEVKSVKMISDRETGRFKGFCFVEMGNEDESKAIVEKLNGQDFKGRSLKVDEARERQQRSGGNRGNRGYNNRGGGYHRR